MTIEQTRSPVVKSQGSGWSFPGIAILLFRRVIMIKEILLGISGVGGIIGVSSLISYIIFWAAERNRITKD